MNEQKENAGEKSEANGGPLNGNGGTPKPKKRTGVLIILGILVIGALYKGYGAFVFAQTHVDTDDAYVTGDIVNISPTVSGTLAELKVSDGDFVHKGQLIARLDTNSSQALLEEAKANLLAAETQVPQAEAELQYTKLSTDAAIRSSQAAIETQKSRTQGSKMQVRLSADTVRNQIREAEGKLLEARAQVNSSQSSVDVARAGLHNAELAVLTAQKTAEAYRASVESARAEASRAEKDLHRYAALFKTEAISQQQYDTAASTAKASAANLDSATKRAEAAYSQIDQARSAVEEAKSRLRSSESQLQAAKTQVLVAVAAVDLARSDTTQIGIQGSNVRTNENQTTQADASLASATAGLQQVALREKQIATAKAQLAQAKAAVEHAKIEVQDATLYAPCDGYVLKHMENVGASISPGQTIVTITRSKDVWIMANYKETQLDKVREGQPVEVEVDAYPGHKFKGKVQSIIRATGSATTLLPPDNATGNFTKVVQRIPVKVVLDGENGDATVLRQGMSVVATIDTASAAKE